ncbi:MAG: RNA polymerase sigma factor [Gemmatimonadetes bacterium]|nr:RNA polymerase sigma factor [Gemmatimonadota bacterium]
MHDAPRADDAFTDELLRYLPDLARFARALAKDHADADDLVQDTYLRAYRARDTFKPEFGARQWLFTICRNTFLRGREREKWIVGSLDEGDPADETVASVALHRAAREAGHEDVFDRLDFGPALQRAMTQLGEPYRLAFALVDLGDLSYAEAAAELGVPLGTVRSRLFRARRELQQHLIACARDAGLVRGKHGAADSKGGAP